MIIFKMTTLKSLLANPGKHLCPDRLGWNEKTKVYITRDMKAGTITLEVRINPCAKCGRHLKRNMTVGHITLCRKCLRES